MGRKIFKIILICLISIIGLLFGYGTVRTIIIYYQLNVGVSYFDLRMLLPIILFILSIPSLIFNIKTISHQVLRNKFEDGLLDSSFANETNPFSNLSQISIFLWITNFINGLIVLVLGIILSIDTIKNETLSDFSFGFYIYLLCMLTVFIGVSIIADEIYLLILKKKQKSIIKESD